MGESSFLGEGNIHLEATLVLYALNTVTTCGGRIRVRFACRVNLERTPDDPHIASLTYGPYVLAALTDSVNFLELPFDGEGALEQLVKAEGEISLQYRDVKFVPLSSICHEPYQVYFKTKE